VSVAPASVSVLLGEPQTFIATVSDSTGSLTSTAVNWSVNGVPGGNATVGTISTSGVYTAPADMPAAASVNVRATSVADPTKSGTATITITGTFSLTLTGPASINTGAAANFLATLTPVAGSNPSRTIQWSVSGAGCTGAACGSISSAGIYTAPILAPSPATVQIRAMPLADPSKSASVTLTILSAIGVSISPTAATAPLGGTETFQATVTGAQDATVTWDVNGVVGGNATVGTILNSQINPDQTTYTAPQSLPSGSAVTVHARSNANPNISASAAVTFTSAIAVTLTPTTATRAIGHRQTFTVQVSNAATQTVSWQVNRIAGGNSSAGQICVTGSSPCQQTSSSSGSSVDYLAPAGLPSPNPVSVTATSQADNTKSASASVTILPHIIVSVLPGSVTLSGGSQQRFAATVTGTDNQQVTWSVTGAGCGVSGACGSIDSTGLFVAPISPPSPNSISVTATSSENTRSYCTTLRKTIMKQAI